MEELIPKELKYNLHYGKVRGDVLPPLQGTMGTNDPQGMASLDPKGLIHRIYVGDH